MAESSSGRFPLTEPYFSADGGTAPAERQPGQFVSALVCCIIPTAVRTLNPPDNQRRHQRRRQRRRQRL